jgi:hypothetical protein
MIKPMKTARRDMLKLIQTYIQSADNMQVFISEFLPSIKNLVSDYQ